jgi:PAS domain S-box-containing protein
MRERLIDRAVEVLDRLAPVSSRSENPREALRRARMTVAAALLGGGILVTTATSTLILGLDSRLATVNLGWAAAIFALLGVARWFGSPTLLANSLVAMGFMHVLALSTFAGGRNIGALFAFAVFPLVAVLMSGWRSGLVFTALSAAGVLLTPLVPLSFLAPTYLEGVAVGPALIRDALNVVFAVGIFSAIYDAARSSTLRDAEHARREAEASEARAQFAADRQRKLIELSRCLQEATFETFDRELGRAMELAAGLAGADRTVLRLFHGGEYEGRFSWGESEDMPTIALTDVGVAAQSFTWTASFIGSGDTAQVRRLEDLPAEAAAERAYLERRGVSSWLCVPVVAGKRPIGYQSFETTRQEKQWNDEAIAALRLMTELLAAAVLRHRTEKALRESEAKFAAAFRDHPDAMVITDIETDEILECNEQWLQEIGGRTRDQVLGRRPFDFDLEFPEQGREALRRALLTTGRMPSLEVPISGGFRGPRTYLLSATRIDIAGRPCALASLHDLTDRKQLEHQLLHAQKMEAVGRLAGGIAHDYNNMLTVITGYSSSLMESLDGELLDDAEEIHRAARRSADLTRQLLAFSRRQILQTEVLEPNGLVQGLEAMLRPLIGESIELRLELAASPHSVRCDRGQLEQAIVNLVVNARDAMPRGGTLSLLTRNVRFGRIDGDGPRPPDLDPGEYVVITVADDGYGMDAEVAAHVMEPFYTTKPEGQGTGLGLPMVHGLATQCGGTLVLESQPGRGTRANVYLPAVFGPVDPAGAHPILETSPSETKSYLVLLVEDEATVRRLAARSLRSAGYEVEEAENGEVALARATELGDALDVVVSDVVMPRLSGIELVRRLREQRGDLPVVLMSGYPDAAGSSPVPDDVLFLPKPFEPGRLRASVEKALRGKREALPAV